MSTTGLTDALRETLAVVEDAPGGAPLTATEVAERLGLGRRSAYERLERLVDRDRLETKEVGARGRVWWLPRDRDHGVSAPTTDGTGASSAGEFAETNRSFEVLVEAVEEYAIFHLAPDGTVTSWNSSAKRIKGYDREEIVGKSFERFYSESDVAEGVPQRNLEAAAREGWIEDEGWRIRADGSEFWASVTITAIYGDDGDLEGYAKVTRDMTEQRTFEKRLQRQRDELGAELEKVFERVDDAFLALDRDERVTYINEQAAELLELSVSEAVGTPVWGIVPAIDDPEFRSRIEETVQRQEPFEFDVHAASLGRWLEVRAYPADTGPSLYLRDVTDRKERERELEWYETIVETVDDGIYVVADGRFAMVNDQYVEMTGYSREELLGADVSLVVGDETASKAAEQERALIESDRDTVRTEADVQRADGDTFRAEATFTLLPDSIDADDECEEARNPDRIERACVVRDVTERVERERELERRRERLAALDDLNAVVREITTDVIEQSSREEIERTLCERLAAADSYEFAWVGDVGASNGTVHHRVGAGTGGAFDGLTVETDGIGGLRNAADDVEAPDASDVECPIAHAIETLETQVQQGLADDPAAAAWHERAAVEEERSIGAIPIVHEENCYGVLNVAAAREDAFANEEREVVAQLGTVVGNAIAAIERKRALMCEEVVELQFRLTGIADELGIALPESGRFTLNRTVAIGDGDYQAYGTANEAGVATLRAGVERIPHWEALDTFGDAEGQRRVQLRLVEPPILHTVASRGGTVDSSTLEDGDVRVAIHLVPGADVRAVIDIMNDQYAGAELLTRTQRSRGELDRPAVAGTAVTDQLTERQRVVLETAYNMGFFERPRLHSGEEIADTLGVTAATFHQHLRKAEQQLLGVAVDGSID